MKGTGSGRADEETLPLRFRYRPPGPLASLRRLAYWRRKEGNNEHMKIIAIITLAAVAIGLGACAKKEAEHTHSTATTGSYSK